MTDRRNQKGMPDAAGAALPWHAARACRRSRRVATFTELVATIALVASIAAILTVVTFQSAGAAPVDALTLSQSERVAVIVGLAFIMAAMGGLTAAMIRRTVGAPRRPRRRR